MAEFVLVGVADAEMQKNLSSWSTNKIGGQADWMTRTHVMSSCSRCGKARRLVVQIYCPLENSKYHRTLYVFCCPNKHCWTNSSGWKVYRDQLLEKQEEKHVIEVASTVESWGCDDDDWGDGNSPSPPDVKDDDIKQTDKPEVKNPQELDILSEVALLSMNQPFKSRYINVFNESDLIPIHDGDKHIDDLISNYEKSVKQDSKENDLFAGCSVSVESYETNFAKVKNKKFHEFQKKVSLLPEQVIRYNYGGKPLLLSDFDETTVIPKCVCGKPLVFEFQLMPSMIPYLQLDGEDSVEFGTILVYTCSSGCWGEGVSQEIGGHVVYCPDPDLKFFKSQSFGTTENANK